VVSLSIRIENSYCLSFWADQAIFQEPPAIESGKPTKALKWTNEHSPNVGPI
jgi:hypothetical protein